MRSVDAGEVGRSVECCNASGWPESAGAMLRRAPAGVQPTGRPPVIPGCSYNSTAGTYPPLAPRYSLHFHPAAHDRPPLRIRAHSAIPLIQDRALEQFFFEE